MVARFDGEDIASAAGPAVDSAGNVSGTQQFRRRPLAGPVPETATSKSPTFGKTLSALREIAEWPCGCEPLFASVRCLGRFFLLAARSTSGRNSFNSAIAALRPLVIPNRPHHRQRCFDSTSRERVMKAPGAKPHRC